MFIELHNSNGVHILVNVDEIEAICTDKSTGGTLLDYGRDEIHIRESYIAVRSLLDNAGRILK